MFNHKIAPYIVLLFILVFGCEDEKRFPPQGFLPNSPKEIEQLEAAYFWKAQDKINSSYWKNANYISVELKNIEIKNLYPDGYLNMTGTYNGLNDFNRGTESNLTLKAGYDETFLYILVEWKDTTSNASNMSWLWNGKKDIQKSDSTTGWTSQKNNDNISIIFRIDDTHSNIWKWSLAESAPFDMALNLSGDGNGNSTETENLPYSRNSTAEGSRTGPAYEWNGTRQEIILSDGSTKILDPAYYLSDNYKMDFKGDVAAGEIVFNNTADCRYCHGINGNGEPDSYTDGGTLNSETTNKYTREGLIEFIGSSGHEGGGGNYFGKIKNDTLKINNLLAFMRGIAGVPGNVLDQPDTEPEIKAITNISVGGIQKQNSKYQVLLRRKLTSIKEKNISFDPFTTYKFHIRLSDNDEINYIGSSEIILTFKSNEL